MSKTIIVSNRLPVKISHQKNKLKVSPSEGGLATGMGSIYREGNNIWIGWPGIEIESAEQQQLVTKELESENLVPVFLSEQEIKRYYEGFSNEVLWPVFHYLSTYAVYSHENWLMYKQVNEKFKNVILEHLEPGDVLWIHDYQLLLVPGMVREVLPDISIAFFQHIPFPSLELFRLIPWREEILQGMLGADLIGFHTFDDARHFINSASHLLPAHGSANMVRIGERVVIAEPFPMGIDSHKFSKLSSSAKVKKQIVKLKENFKEQKLILSIDRLDYSKGILQRLEAFSAFLEANPEYSGKVTYYMIVVPSRDNVAQYRELKNEIDRLVGNINARFRTFDWHPIAYFYHGYPIEVISALFTIADICLVTPMRDGMNLVSKEYVASRNDNRGVLILSEMAGASKELIDAIIVNPNSYASITNALLEALTMSPEEEETRMKAMRQVVFKFTIHHWVGLFMKRLDEVKQIQQSMRAKLVQNTIRQNILERFASAKKRLIILDYDGTLVGFQKQIDKASPDKALYRLLDRLNAAENTRLVIVSGRKYQTLDSWFGHKGYDLVAEHGAWKKLVNEAWVQRPGLSNRWKSEVCQLMESFADRTPGAFVEEKSYSLVWHYRKVQEGLGAMRANELMDNLRYYLTSHGLQLLDGDKVVEVKNSEVNKGRATMEIMHGENYDYIMAIGDDHTDEDIFRALPADAVSIKVGSNVSAANFYVSSYLEVRNLLDSLSPSGVENYLS
jgi:trehalose 6-phosphate synthase/phosphatase